ncbi:MFS transporter [Catellatospora sp. TT07R-123]|uniref:MFS transporter n=1 Tax=Catellatospora sp. TT07R-123 TaxID=2733863 RepID=UPI001B088DA5|nr:MFS transporter [Catellatospora sp. TT07R-123]GHJ43205.1 MFS transporter [Catellatospora sp. TT07R-123]
MSTATTEQAAVPLSRNRDYQLVWGSQALTDFGVNAATIALPLLALSVTGSAARSGLVLAAAAGARLAAGLPAGALVDRWNRKAIMIGCAVAQTVTAASLAAAVSSDLLTLAHLVVAAVVMGACAALFDPAEDASLPNLVAAEQLASAVALKSARVYLGQLTGTAAGGFLYAAARALPFAAGAAVHAVACLGLLFLRLPGREPSPAPAAGLGADIGAGLRWVWQHRYIRVAMACAVTLNLFFSAFYLVAIVLAASRGVPSGQIGVMAAMLGAGGVVGALLAPRLSQRLSAYTAIVSVFWIVALLTPIAVVIHNGYLMGVLFFVMALPAPTATTIIVSRLLLLTPDHLRGRLSSVLGLTAGIAATAGPVLGGALAQAVTGGQATLICAAGVAVMALVVTLSPTLRAGTPDQA